jgi:tetratricopeptide (TPR) repeat protein
MWRKAKLARGFSLALLASAQHQDIEELIENHRWPQAAQRLQSVPDNDARLNWLAGRVRFAYHDLDKAAGFTEKAAALDPKNADYQFLLYEVYGSQAAEASVFRQPGLARKCKKAVDNAVALNPKHAEALTGLMIYLYRAPGFFGGDKKRAYSIPAEIAAFSPARGHLAQAEIDLLEKRPDLARESYRKAVAADPNLFAARLQLARSLSDQPEQAEAHAREAIRIKPKRLDGWELLAYALGRQGKIAELDQTIAKMDDSAGLFHGARGLLDGSKDKAKAQQMLRQYVKQPSPGPERPTAAQAESLLKNVSR